VVKIFFSCGENLLMLLICFKTNHVQIHHKVNTIAEYFLLKTAVNQRQSQKRWCFTNYLVL